MKRIATLVACGMLFACGTTEDTDFALTSGTYKLTAVTTAKDDCKVLDSINTDKFMLQVATDGTAVTAYLTRADGTADQTKATGTMSASTLSASAEVTGEIFAGCTTHFKKAFSGTISAADTAQVTYTWDENVVSGNCPAVDLGWTEKCHSEATFTVTKVL